MLGLDNSQISEEAPEDSSRSEMQELNHLREMLPEPIVRLHDYLLEQTVQNPSEELTEGEELSEGEEPTAEEQEMMLKIREQARRVLELEERLYYYRSECMRLIEENRQVKELAREAERTAGLKEELLAEAQAKLEEVQGKLEEVQGKLEEECLRGGRLEGQVKEQEEKARKLGKAAEKGAERKEREISFRNTYNQELLSKELLIQEKVIVELTHKNQKMLRINGLLEGELRRAEEKLIAFEMEVQQKMCSILVDNVSRLKENQSHISRSSHSYSLTQIHSNPQAHSNIQAEFTSTRPLLEENRTLKLQSSQDMSDQQQGRDFKTIEKDRIVKAEFRYDYKLQPVESPKPHRKCNRMPFQTRKEGPQPHKQSTKYNF